MAYEYKPFEVRPAPELSERPAFRSDVIIVGAGPVGLAAAVDLALHNVACVVVDDDNVVSLGSRAICWAKRTLEIMDRLGVGERMRDKGITWKVGRLFDGADEVFAFDLLPEAGHNMPAFVNLQQYYVEEFLIDRCRDFPDIIDLRWKNRLVGLVQDDDRVTAMVETPQGAYELRAPYLVACDGARSATRRLMKLGFTGSTFKDRFLIADIEMEADFPAERWFWFNPPFHSGKTALLHKQPDNIYRIDLQLGPDADPDEEKKPENVIPRIDKAVGGRPFKLDWVSVYTFQCRRLERFVHDRVIFAGDAAHIVSPFGARGGNGGIHDVDNLCWKLASVVDGTASDDLLRSYDEERRHGADENILHSTRATNFMMAREPEEEGFRDAVLDLAHRHPFAQKLINSGRLSTACRLAGLSSISSETTSTRLVPGDPCLDAPYHGGWLLQRLGGDFSLLAVGIDVPERIAGLNVVRAPATGPVADRYGRGIFLVRPDQYIAAVWDDLQPEKIAIELARAGLRVAEPA